MASDVFVLVIVLLLAAFTVVTLARHDQRRR
jgi:hypothetical protein